MSEKPKINYPTEWSYKIIARNEEAIQQVVKTTQHSSDLQLKYSNTSKKGTFTSMECTTLVMNEEERLGLYQKFKANPDIKMVL